MIPKVFNENVKAMKNRNLILLITINLSLFAVYNAAAQKTPDTIVNKAAAVFMKNPGKVGLSVGIVDHEHFYRYNYGETAPGSGIAPTSKTVYEIGSISKSFTGLLIAHALADGKMKLNADIRLYLKGSYPNLQYNDGRIVRLVYLLNHIARFPRMATMSFFKQGDLEQELHTVKLDTLLPYRYNYSNFGYQVLGLLVENAYGKSYDDLIKQYITGPWNMPDTKAYFDTSNLIRGYNRSKAAMPEIPAIYPGAGGLRSNVDDMLRYADNQLREDDSYVRMTHRLQFSGSEGDDAMPWSIGRNRNWDFYIREDGGTLGFRTFISLFPDDQIGIVLLSNETDDDAGKQLYDMINTILDGLKKQQADKH